MKSIRLSLIVYFLLLLGAALGAVSVFVYRSTYQTLLAKKETTRQLLQAQYQDRCNQVRAKLDEELYHQARALARLAQSQSHFYRIRFQSLHPLGLLSACPTPNGHLLAPLWVAQAGPNALTHRMQRLVPITEIQFSEDVVPRLASGPTEYFQVNSQWDNTWRSRSMAGYELPFDAKAFAKMPFFDYRFDEVLLMPQDTEAAHTAPPAYVRRVTLKAPATRFRHLWSPPAARDASPERRTERTGGRRPPPPVFEGFALPIFIQCACDTSQRDADLENLAVGLVEALHALEAESDASLSSLRNRLLVISLSAFAAALLGGCWLVQLGLSPLRQLSNAVSEVSAKDFRLPFNEPHLPRELRPIVERLTETLAMLQRAFAREKQAAADISHELRTPLSALLTTTEVTLRKPRSAEQYREALSECRSTGRRMNQLVERLLALARLDANVDALLSQDVDAGDLAEECAALVRPLAEARGLDLQVRRTGSAHVRTDPNKLQEIVNNLLHNAIEYNKPNGSIELSVGRDNGHLRLEVRDTGIGIDPAAQAHIFERFFRADPSRQADGLHAGLGLAIVKGYVDLMEGRIEVESEEGQGSTFRIHLPA